MKYIQHFSIFVLTLTLTNISYGSNCSIDVESTDAMQFNTKSISVDKSCKEFTVNLSHTGKLPKNAMGHNWVLTKSDDVNSVASDGISAGLGNEYLKPNDDRVIAFTKIIGGGEKTRVTFMVDKLSSDQEYTFFCSFPGHSAIMKGELSLN